MEHETLSKAVLIQAQMLAHAKEKILDSGDLVTSNVLARLLGVSEKDSMASSIAGNARRPSLQFNMKAQLTIHFICSTQKITTIRIK